MKLIEMYEYNQNGYAKLMNYKEWRVAMLNFSDELLLENINYVEAHNETDEVFVLLEGSCKMILMEFDNKNLKEIEVVELEKNKIYNVPKDIHHSHVLSKDAKVLIIEQEDTNDENSNRVYLTEEIKKILIEKMGRFINV